MFRFANFIINAFRRTEDEYAEEEDSRAYLMNSFQSSYRLRIFKQVLDDIHVKDFLEFDECYLLADNYLISMVFIYFIRSELDVINYNAQHFFSALYLAHEMEEDLEELKKLIVPWFPGPSRHQKCMALNEIKFILWRNMNHDCLVRRSECEWVMRKTSNWSVWKRIRHITHFSYSIQRQMFKRCCAYLLEKALHLDPASIVIENDVMLHTSDWKQSYGSSNSCSKV